MSKADDDGIATMVKDAARVLLQYCLLFSEVPVHHLTKDRLMIVDWQIFVGCERRRVDIVVVILNVIFFFALSIPTVGHHFVERGTFLWLTNNHSMNETRKDSPVVSFDEHGQD